MKKLHAPTLLSAEHKLEQFNCGENTLDEWLKKHALKNQRSGASRCYVICQELQVIGFYTLSAGAISHLNSPKSMRRNMPDPLPVLLLGRLAIDKKHHNKGLGSALLRDALIRAEIVSREAGVFAILIHALSEQAKLFYKSRGFVESPLQTMTFMMTLETDRTILSE